MKYMRITAGYTWTDYKTNAQIAKELKITPISDKLLEYKRSWIQHINRMPRNRLPRVMKYYSPTGRRNHGRLWRDFIISSSSSYDNDDDDKNAENELINKIKLIFFLWKYNLRDPWYYTVHAFTFRHLRFSQRCGSIFFWAVTLWQQANSCTVFCGVPYFHIIGSSPKYLLRLLHPQN